MALLRYSFLILLFVLSAPSGLMAAGIPWSKPNQMHIARDEDIKSLLRSFTAGQGITAVINESIEGKVNGRFDETDPDIFFNQMMKVYNLVWFYDGNVLYIDPSVEVKTQAVPASYLTVNKLIDVTNKLGFDSSRSSIHSLSGDGTIFISGPSRFVNAVASLGMQFEADAERRAMSNDVIRVFPLKYAWAYDLNFNYQGGGLTVPGVASLLQALILNQPGTLKQVGNSVIPSPHARKRERITPTVGDPKKQDGQPESSTVSADPEELPQSISASIQSDVRLNAIVIRDTRERMPLYEETIKELDKPVAVIEISAAIVDVDTKFVHELGNRYFTVTHQDDAFAMSPPEGFSSNSSTSFAGGIANLALQGTVNGYKFLEEVRALEEDNHAQILSRPSVLTLDNIEAIIDQQQQVFVRVRSERDASLFDYSAGTVLKVTPHVIYEEKSRKVKLLVNIQDGKIDNNEQVDRIPTVIQSTITTQAIINENQSLLIGGYYMKKKGRGESGLPFLRSLPIVGYLFKTATRAEETIDRMFLITPRIVDVDTVDTKDFKKYFVPPNEVDDLDLEKLPDGYAQPSTPVVKAKAKDQKTPHYWDKHKAGPRRF